MRKFISNSVAILAVSLLVFVFLVEEKNLEGFAIAVISVLVIIVILTYFAELTLRSDFKFRKTKSKEIDEKTGINDSESD